MRKVQLLIVCVLLTLLSGCCRALVENIGKTYATLTPQSAYIDASQNVIVKLSLLRKGENDSTQGNDLGPRWLVCPAPTFERDARESIEKGKANWENGKCWISMEVNSFQYPTTDAEAQRADGWYLYPYDFLNSLLASAPPLHVGTTSTPPCGCEQSSSRCFLDYRLDGRPHNIMIVLPVSSDFGHPQGRYQEKWAVPVKAALLVPAVAVDVVTFPIQFLAVVGYLSAKLDP